MKKMDLTRKELYNLVWERPLKYIIDSYGGKYQDVKDLLKNMIFPHQKMDIGLGLDLDIKLQYHHFPTNYKLKQKKLVINPNMAKIV